MIGYYISSLIPQVPTYHLVVEVLLIVYILRLLLSKNHEKPKDEKLTKEV